MGKIATAQTNGQCMTLTSDSGDFSPAAIVAETNREIASLTGWIARVISPDDGAAAISQEVATLAASIALATVLPHAVQLNAYFAAEASAAAQAAVEPCPPISLEDLSRAFVFRRPSYLDRNWNRRLRAPGAA